MALFRSDQWVKSVLGNAIAGAQIFVCNQPADVSYLPPVPLALIFSDPAGLVPIVQPVITDGFGHTDFYVPFGTYTVVVVNGGNIQQVYEDQTIGFSTGTSLVTSVFGRLGDVVAQASDYSAFYAPLVSPAFTGVPTAPTAAPSTNTTQVATCAFVLANVGGGAVSSVFGRTGAIAAQSGDYSAFYDVLGAAATAQSNAETYANSVSTSGTAANLSGTPALPNGTTATTQTLGDNSTKLATTAFVLANAGGGGGNTVPLLSLFTAVNASSYLTALQRGGVNTPIWMTINDNSSINWRLYTQNVPVSPYKVQMEIDVFNGGWQNSQSAGLYFYDGTKLMGLEFLMQVSGGKWRVERVTNVNADASTAYAESTQYQVTSQEVLVAGVLYQQPLTNFWAQLRNDGTNLYFDLSFDGDNFFNVYSEAVGFFITPTQSGFGGLSITTVGTQHVNMAVKNWIVSSNANL